MDFKPPSMPGTNKEKIENNSRLYNLDSGVSVDLTFKEFKPKKENNEDPHKAVVFLAGLTMKPDGNTMQGLGQAYAESSKENTYVVQTELKADKNIKEEELDLFYEEARGVSEFIKEKQLTEITIAGYSIGGYKAINLVDIIQNNPGVKVNGLILLSSPGLYEQETGSLKKNLLKDSIYTPQEVLKRKYVGAFKKGFQGSVEVASNLLHGSLSKNSRQKIKRDFSEMEHFNPRVANIEVPVVIVQGLNDQVVEADKIVPKEEKNREEYLKNNIFKKSPYVRMVIAKKLGKHGLAVLRPEEVADASMYLLGRFNRPR